MSETTSPQEWKALYTAAMLECDDTLLRQRIETADAVIRARLRQLPEPISFGSEQEDLRSALDYLRMLKNTLPADFSNGAINLCL
jgi:hypothetical protein